MTPLSERKAKLWGREHDVIPYLLDAIHGDGKQWIAFGYLDDRPRYYVVRIDSRVRPDNDCEEWYETVHDWICEQIECEALEFMTDDQLDQWESDDGLEKRHWPIPPRNPCGTEWGEHTPTPEELKIVEGK